MLDQQIRDIITKQLEGNRKITFLVGAGLSAASGIPIFRGHGGYWTDGSNNYTPIEMGTKKMFDVNFNEVWRWYLYRAFICNQAKPNKGHVYLSKIEEKLKDEFSLISQNVDGLHFRKESFIERLYLIHGDLRYMRCDEECTKDLHEIPSHLLEVIDSRETPLKQRDIESLICPLCGELSRPHILWFDEYYNDKYYHLSKVLRIAKSTGLLLIIGTSGATNLPRKIMKNTIARQGIVINIDPNENEFTDILDRLKNGYSIQMTSSDILSQFYNLL